MILWETYFESARQAFGEADYAKASELYASAHEEVESETIRDQRWLQTLLGWARSLLALKQIDEARQRLNVASSELSLCPVNLQLEYLELRADMAHLGEEAGVELAHWETWLGLTQSLTPQEWRLPALARALELAQAQAAPWLTLALEVQRQWCTSLFPAEDPRCLSASQALLQRYLEQEAWTQAEALLRWQLDQGFEVASQMHASQMQLAGLLRRQGKNEEAWALYLPLLQAGQLSPEQQQELIHWALEAGLTQLSSPLVTEWLAACSQPDESQLRLLEKLLLQSQPAEQLKLLALRLQWSEALNPEPERKAHWVYQLAATLQRQDRSLEAQPLWRMIVTEGLPSEALPEAYFQLARQARSQGQVDLELYRQAFLTRLNQPQWDENWLEEAFFWASQEVSQGNLVTASAVLGPLVLQMARQGHPWHCQALLQASKVQRAQGHWRDSLNLLEQAYLLSQRASETVPIADESGRPRQICQEALALCLEQRWAQDYPAWAERLIQWGGQPEPFDQGFDPAKAQALVDSGQWSALEIQMRDLESRLDENSPPEHFSILLLLGDALEQQGRWLEALEYRQMAQPRLIQSVGLQHAFCLKNLLQTGQALNTLSRFSEAEKILVQAVRQHEKVYGSDSLEVGRVLLALSESFRLQGKDHLMEAISGRALSLLERHLPSGHPERVQCRRDRVQWLIEQGRLAEARQQLTNMESEEVQAYGQDHPELAVTLSQWAGLETAEGNYSAAEQNYRRALGLFQRGLGDSHPNVAATLNNLGQNLYRQARYGEARELLEKSLGIFDSHDVGRISAMVNLGLVFHAQQDHNLAQEWLEEAWQLSRNWLGEDDLEVAFCCFNLAEVLQAQGELEDARKLAQQALDIRERRLGGLHPETASSQAQLSRLLLQTGRGIEAIPAVEGSLRIQIQALGPEHPELIPTYTTLGRLYITAQRWEDAQDVLLKAVHMLDRSTSQHSMELASLVAELGELRAAQGDLVQAEGFSARAVEIAAGALSPQHEALDPMMLRLAKVYLAKGSFKEAEACFKRILDQRTQRLGGDHPKVALIWLELAEVQRAQSKQVLAETLAKKALELLRRLPPPGPESEIRAVLEFLLRLAELSDRQEQAQIYRAQLEALLPRAAPAPVLELLEPVPLPSTEPEAPVRPEVELTEPLPENRPPLEEATLEEPVSEVVSCEEVPVTSLEPLPQVPPEPAVLAFAEDLPSWLTEPEPELELAPGGLDPDDPKVQEALDSHNWVYVRELLSPQLSQLSGPPLARALRQLAQADRHLGQRLEAERHLQQALERWEAGDSEVSWLMGELAELSFELAKPEAAEALLRRASEILLHLHGNDSPQLVPWLLRLGQIYLAHRLAQALAPLQRAAVLSRQGHPLTPRVFWTLALVHEQLGEPEAALSCLQQVLETPGSEADPLAHLKRAQLQLAIGQVEQASAGVQVLNDHLPQTEPYLQEEIFALGGRVLLSQQRWQEAEPLLLKALELRSQRLSTMHPQRLPLLCDLTQLYHQQQRGGVDQSPLDQESGGVLGGGDPSPLDQKIIDYARQALELTQVADFDLRQRLWAQLAPALVTSGRSHEAEQIYQQWLEQAAPRLGVQDPALIAIFESLAELKWRRGDLAQAQVLRERAWQIRLLHPPAAEIELLAPLENLAQGAVALASWDKAETWLRRAYALAEKQDPLGAARLALVLGGVFRATARYPEAETALRRSLEVRQAQLGAEHPQTLASLQALAEVYSCQNRLEAAQAMLTRCLEAGRSQLGEEHPDLAGFHRSLGELWARWKRYPEAEESLKRALELLEDQMPPHPQWVPTLEALGQYYQQLDQLAQAAPYFHRALDSLEQQMGPSHLGLADALLHLGELQARQGQVGPAEQSLRRCLELRSQKLPAQHPKLAQVRQVLGQFLHQQGQSQAARELYDQALAALWTEQGLESPQLAECLEGLGQLEFEAGLLSEAEGRFTRALVIRQKEPEARQAACIPTLQRLAQVYGQSRRPELAEKALKKALELAQKIYGADRAEVSHCLELLGQLYFGLGRLVAAEALFDRALEICEQSSLSLLGLAKVYLSQNQLPLAWQMGERARLILEAQSPGSGLEVAQAYFLLAEILRLQGRLPESEGYYQRSWEIRSQQLGEEHPEVQRSLLGLGTALMEQSQASQAEKLFTNALRLLESRLGPVHLDLALPLHSLGLLHRSLGRGASAELHLKRALELRRQYLTPEHPDLATSLQALGQLALDQRNDEAAETYLKQALSIREKVLRADHPALSACLLLLAALYKSQERFAEAEPKLKRVLDQREKLLGHHHPDTASILQELGELHLLQGQTQTAEIFLRRALEILEKTLGLEHPSVVPCLHLLWKVYDSQQRPQEAGAIRSRLQILDTQRSPSS